MRVALSRFSILAVAVALSACKLAAPITAPQTGVVETVNGGAHLTVAKQSFTLRTADGKPLPALDLDIGDQVIHVQNGTFTLPDAALAAIQARGGFVVSAPGYVPRRVDLAGAGTIDLAPVGAPVATGTAGATGGTVAAADGRVAIALPAGLLSTPSAPTSLSLSLYRAPASDLDPTAQTKERTTFLQAAERPAAACDQPLPCPPATTSLGLLVEVDGPLAQGVLMVTYDLATLAQGDQAAAAARLKQTFAAMDATDDPTWRQTLKTQYGITLVGDKLSFPVTLGDNAFNDGVRRIEVDGFGVLGVQLEVTVTSRVAGAPALVTPAVSPGGATSPLGSPGVTGNGVISNDGGSLIGQDGASVILADAAGLIGHDGASLIGEDGASLIGQDGASLIGHDGASVLTDNGMLLIAKAGGSLIGNDGASLIALNVGGGLVGKVRDPLNELPKYRLDNYEDSTTAGASVSAVDLAGTVLGGPVATDVAGAYRLDHLPVTWDGIALKAVVGAHTLLTLGRAPGKALRSADLDASTTGVMALVLDALSGTGPSPAPSPVPNASTAPGIGAGSGPAGVGFGPSPSPATTGQTRPISLAGYAADKRKLDVLLDQAGAVYVVSHNVPQAAAFVRNLFATHGYVAQCLEPPLGAAAPPSASSVVPTLSASPVPNCSILVIATTGTAGTAVDALLAPCMPGGTALVATLDGIPVPAVVYATGLIDVTLPVGFAPGTYPLMVSYPTATIGLYQGSFTVD